MDDIQLIHGDCLKVLPTLRAGSVDIIITDPPYTTPTVTAFGRETVKNFADFSIQTHYVRSLKNEFERILKSNGRVFIFCDDKYYPVIYPVFYDWQASQLVVWDKGRIGMGKPFRKRHELIFYACRDSYEHEAVKGVTHFPTVMLCPPENEKEHGAQKPIELIKKLILGFSKEGDTVLDCFLGSGTTAVAAQELKRNFIGIELNRDYFCMAQKRLTRTVQRELPLTS